MQTAERETWLRHRFHEVAAASATVTPGLADWARRQIGGCRMGASLAADLGWDAASEARPRGGLDRTVGRGARARSGQVFTPTWLADLLARVVGARRPRGPGGVLDPACGDGRLLVAVAEARRGGGAPVSEALRELVGWDRDPAAVFSARAALVAWALHHAGDVEALPDLDVSVVDALSERGPAAVSGQFGLVVANPPYLEAKRMARAEPELRRRLRARLPALTGAWDLYLAFALLCRDWAAPGGDIGLLLPNKVLQSRYAARFRASLGTDGVQLASVVDLGTCHPRPFPGTGVYPVVLHLRRAESPAPIRTTRLASPEQPLRWTELDPDALGAVGGEHPLFVPRATWDTLQPLLALPRLHEVAELRSTCSFHARGLRERFVTAERPDGDDVYPYLGGPSRTRRTEVSCFRVEWAEWWIHFDQDTLRGEHRNALPPLSTFQRPKVIWCQHGLRMRPVVDRDGRWVTKDVYPVAWPKPGAVSLDALAAILASTVFTALYNTVYHGIVCGSETYHYLPAFLRNVPVPRPDHPALAVAAALVPRLHAPGPLDHAAWAELDALVAEAYGVGLDSLAALVREHLARVGAEHPGEAPA